MAERRVTDLDAEVDLALPAPVGVLAPADDGTLGLADEIEWSGGPEGGGYLVYFACRTATGPSTGRDVVYRLVEPERRSTAVPAIPGVGLGIGCSWRVGWSSDGAFPELGIGGRTDDEHLESWGGTHPGKHGCRLCLRDGG